MSDRIGYVDANCALCGEHYNGYSTHECPTDLARAMESLVAAASKWAEENEGSHRKTDATLLTALTEYQRSVRAEPALRKFHALFAGRSGLLKKHKPRSIKKARKNAR